MASEQTVDRIAAKFQQWAETLSAEEQKTLAEWMVRLQKDEARGYSARWYVAPGAWSQAYKAAYYSEHG